MQDECVLLFETSCTLQLAFCIGHGLDLFDDQFGVLQALISSLGWTYLDVRSTLETEDVGKVRVAVNVPFVNATKKWDSEQGKKVVKKEDNLDFVKQVSAIRLPSLAMRIKISLNDLPNASHMYRVSCPHKQSSQSHWSTNGAQQHVIASCSCAQRSNSVSSCVLCVCSVSTCLSQKCCEYVAPDLTLPCMQVERKFPDKAAKLLIGCSNGRQYSMDALMELDDAGYINLAGLKGGFNAWNTVFDSKLNRRRTGEYAEQYTHDGDSAGIHSSGAGFPRMDPADRFVPQEY